MKLGSWQFRKRRAHGSAELTFSDFLEHVLKVEVEGRHERAKQTLLKMATLPGIKTLEDYDYPFACAPKAQIQPSMCEPVTCAGK